MEEKDRGAKVRFLLAVAIGLALWVLALVWYLYCKRNGSVYSGTFLAVNAPGLPGGFIGYWIYTWRGDGSASGPLYTLCEMGLPSITLCLAWVNLSYQGLSLIGRRELPDPRVKRRALLALIPFLVGWCIMPFVIGTLAA